MLYSTENGIYNAVWDEKILLCYDILQCKCGKQVGISIHATSFDKGLQSLIGKVSSFMSSYILDNDDNVINFVL